MKIKLGFHFIRRVHCVQMQYHSLMKYKKKQILLKLLITNIVIKKRNDVQLKETTDRAVQTSLLPQVENPSPKNVDSPNVSINNNEVNIEQQQIEKQESPKLQASSSAKENTASADTGIGQHEITENIEIELSDIIKCDERYILLSTAHNGNKRQRSNEKIHIGDANEGPPASKKLKLTNTGEVNKIAEFFKQYTLNTNDFHHLKDSETIFSVCVEKKDVPPKSDKIWQKSSSCQ